MSVILGETPSRNYLMQLQGQNDRLDESKMRATSHAVAAPRTAFLSSEVLSHPDDPLPETILASPALSLSRMLGVRHHAAHPGPAVRGPRSCNVQGLHYCFCSLKELLFLLQVRS